MTRALFFLNITRESPGLIVEALETRRWSYDVVDLSSGDTIPPLDQYRALIVMGGPASANDATPTMQAEVAAVRLWLASQRPFFGVCLGLQVAIKALDGSVGPSPVREIGWRNEANELFTITLTAAGRDDALFTGVNTSFPVFQLHGETVTLTPSMTLVGTSPAVPNQFVRFAPGQYGVQAHLELTPELFNRWLDEDPDLQEQHRDQLITDYEAVRSEYEAAGHRVITNFLNLIGA